MKQGWEIKKLGEVVKKLFAGGDKPKLFAEYQTEQLSIPVYANGISLDGLVGYTDKAIVEEESITISARGTIGFCCVRKSPFVPIVRLITLIPSEDIKTEYLYYVLRNTKFDNNGVAIPQLTIPMIREMLIPIPPREEQERIVEELDCLSGVIEKKRKQLKQLDALAQSIFYTMFGDPITNEKGWEVKKLGEVCAEKKMISRATKVFNESDEINYIDISAIDNSTNVITSPTNYRFEDAPSRAQQVVKCGDILVSMVRPNLKNIAIVNLYDDNLVASSGFCVLRVEGEIERSYLFYIVKSNAFTEYLMERVSGANYPAVRECDITDYSSILPPLALQQEFAEKIEAIEEQKALIKQSITQTEELFNARMDYYFN